MDSKAWARLTHVYSNKEANFSFPIVAASVMNEHKLVFTLLTQKNNDSPI